MNDVPSQCVSTDNRAALSTQVKSLLLTLVMILTSVLFFVGGAEAQDPPAEPFSELVAIEQVPDVLEMVFSQEQDRLVVRRPVAVDIYVASTGELIDGLVAESGFGDMALTPDGRYLFVVEDVASIFGQRQFIRRVDLATGASVALRALGDAQAIAAISAERLVRSAGQTLWLEVFDSSNGVIAPLSSSAVPIFLPVIDYHDESASVIVGDGSSSSRRLSAVVVADDVLQLNLDGFKPVIEERDEPG